MESTSSHTTSSSNPARTIALTALRFFIYSLILGAAVLALTWEAKRIPIERLFSEQSLLEYFQEGALLITVLLCAAMGRINRDQRALAWILGGAALVAFIRELDAFLDANVFDGAWQTLAALALIAVAIRVYTLRNGLKETIVRFINRPSFGIMASGFMTVFVFSRLFGRTVFWEAVMGDHYIRVVKNLAEEGTELLGYLLILIAVIELVVDVIGQKKN
jgi:hypothetical protein